MRDCGETSWDYGESVTECGELLADSGDSLADDGDGVWDCIDKIKKILSFEKYFGYLMMIFEFILNKRIYLRS